jgi:hypothetical protein
MDRPERGVKLVAGESAGSETDGMSESTTD